MKVITFFLCIFFTCINISQAERLENDISATWQLFLNAISNNDIEQVKKLSNKKISCYLCLENTKEEHSEIIKLLNEKGGYDKIYKYKIYIPIQKFCDDEISIIFTKGFIKKLKQNETFYDKKIIDGKAFYEVLVTTTLPGEISPAHEGGQHVFQFIETKNGYRFYGIETIP
jgi:hypothetical protein